jgi:hypothetical protein
VLRVHGLNCVDAGLVGDDGDGVCNTRVAAESSAEAVEGRDTSKEEEDEMKEKKKRTGCERKQR